MLTDENRALAQEVFRKSPGSDTITLMAKAIAVEREACAQLMRELLDKTPRKHQERRMAFAIAENSIRRGRNLTAREQLENLETAIRKEG